MIGGNGPLGTDERRETAGAVEAAARGYGLEAG